MVWKSAENVGQMAECSTPEEVVSTPSCYFTFSQNDLT